jgi:hypothetical protein
MNKNPKQAIKLKLHRETLQSLEKLELQAVVGGASILDSRCVECRTEISCYC